VLLVYLHGRVGGGRSSETLDNLLYVLNFDSSEEQPSGQFCLDLDWHSLL